MYKLFSFVVAFCLATLAEGDEAILIPLSVVKSYPEVGTVLIRVQRQPEDVDLGHRLLAKEVFAAIKLVNATETEVSIEHLKDRAGNKCPVPFARNWPFGCFAQMVPDTYFPLIAKTSCGCAAAVVSDKSLAKGSSTTLPLRIVPSELGTVLIRGPFSHGIWVA